MKLKLNDFTISSSVLLLFGVFSQIAEGRTITEVQEDVTNLGNRMAVIESKLKLLFSDVRSNTAEMKQVEVKVGIEIGTVKEVFKSFKDEFDNFDVIFHNELLIEVKQVQETMEIEVGVAKEVFKFFKDELQNLKESINHQQELFLSNTQKMKEDIETFKCALKENTLNITVLQNKSDHQLQKEKELIPEISELKKELQSLKRFQNKTTSDILAVRTKASFQEGIDDQFSTDLQKMNLKISDMKSSLDDELLLCSNLCRSTNASMLKIENKLQKYLEETDKTKADVLVLMNDTQNLTNEIRNISLNLNVHNTSNTLTFRLENKLETIATNLTNNESECIRHTQNAESCIQTANCGYCVNDDFASFRCGLTETLIAKGCPKDEIVISEESTEYRFGIQSQNVVHLCPGMKRNVTVTYQNIKQPVDLYLLLDIVYHNWLKGNKNVRSNFWSTLQNISVDYRFGFGVTGDKPKLPFSNITSFSFKNHLPLTTRFPDKIDVGQYSYELADPRNGQLEGIFQAVSCKNQIKWRKDSLKILFVVSAFPYHVQGDGSLGGISKPFDGLCSLNETGYYVNELTQDYPSEDQIFEIVKDENMNVVFGVTNSYATFQQFKSLADRLDPPAFIYDDPHGNDTRWSDILKDAYQKMTSVVDLHHRRTSEDIGVKYHSNCSGTKEEKGSKCSGVNGNLTFKVEIEMLSCPSNVTNRNQILSISPKGQQTSAEIPIHLLCNCP